MVSNHFGVWHHSSRSPKRFEVGRRRTPEQFLAEGFHRSFNSLRTLSDNVKCWLKLVDNNFINQNPKLIIIERDPSYHSINITINIEKKQFFRFNVHKL